jgi:hypothetical protein
MIKGGIGGLAIGQDLRGKGGINDEREKKRQTEIYRTKDEEETNKPSDSPLVTPILPIPIIPIEPPKLFIPIPFIPYPPPIPRDPIGFKLPFKAPE